MKAQEKEEKDALKFRYAVALNKLLKESSLGSWRKLATAVGIEPSHLQQISTGRRDVTHTTTIALLNGLLVTYPKFAECYYNVTDGDTAEYRLLLEKQRKIRGKAKNKRDNKPPKKG